MNYQAGRTNGGSNFLEPGPCSGFGTLKVKTKEAEMGFGDFPNLEGGRLRKECGKGSRGVSRFICPDVSVCCINCTRSTQKEGDHVSQGSDHPPPL